MAEEAMAKLAEVGLIGLGAGLAIGLGALGAGYAQGKIGSAMAAASAERPEMQGSMLLYLVIPETIVLFAFAIAYLLIEKL
ncbi:MAG: V-type ATP synthase subunit K [Candidatus Micrarchaeota archaeon]|nr:V-type ATP synthase subunit K [Candidatus Micrarchaeota archaeon]